MKGWWIGRVVGRMVVCRLDRCSVLVARLHWWWLEGRIVGRLMCMWLNRRLVLVGRIVPNLRRKMSGLVVQRMGWSVEV